MGKLYQRMKPFIGVILLQFGFAGMDILSKVALNEGMSNYVFVVYRHAVATIVIVPFAIILDKSVSFSLSLYMCVSCDNSIQVTKTADITFPTGKQDRSWLSQSLPKWCCWAYSSNFPQNITHVFIPSYSSCNDLLTRYSLPLCACVCRPVIDQNLYFLGMKYTTATFAAAMSNILPAITFVMAWVLR